MKKGRLLFVILLELIAVSCTTRSEEIGRGFIVRTRVYHGISHQYEERDLYYKGLLGVRRLIHKDISGAKVSPKGEVVLFLARRPQPEPTVMDQVLYVFDRRDGEMVRIADGRFDFSHDCWSPSGDMFMYRKFHKPIMVFSLAAGRSWEIAEEEFYFLGWSPSGNRVAYATDKSVYEVNALYSTDVKQPQRMKVGEKKGEWKKEDFDWVTVGEEEKIVLK